MWRRRPALFRVGDIPRNRRQLPRLDAVVLFLHPRDALGVAFHPERDGRVHPLLVQLGELDDDVLARVTAQVVQLAHVDAVGRTRLSAQRTEQALAVVDRVAKELAALGVDLAGLLIDLARGGLVDVDAIDRAGLGAHVAGDALVLLELVDAAVARGEGEPLLGVLHGHRLLKAVLDRDLHPDRDRADVVVDVLEIAFDAHRDRIIAGRRGKSTRRGRRALGSAIATE